jgi:precorrin-6Y C5,15-methyltransferase (decarboxylating)
MTPIQVVGVGLEGRSGLPQRLLNLIDQASLLVGSPRQLSYFPEVTAQTWPLQDLGAAMAELQHWLAQPDPGLVVILASGDPLFFGLGRLLLAHLPADSLTFHPQVSAMQLAFSRLKLPWQGATLVSAHGRSVEALVTALRRGDELLAVLTDPSHSPACLGRLILDLALPCSYRLWVCENLGDDQEQIHDLTPESVQGRDFSGLNVVVLQRLPYPPGEQALPWFGLPDRAFDSFSDRPGLITKRDIRIQILADLALQHHQVIWDIGAGTGSVSIEINRLCPEARVYAIEKTLAGVTLIDRNRQRLGDGHLHIIHGAAPDALTALPAPNRVFIGGSGGSLGPILDHCGSALLPQGQIVLALATLEHLEGLITWVGNQGEPPASPWHLELRQLQISHSVEVGRLHRWQPLTPITLATVRRA